MNQIILFLFCRLTDPIFFLLSWFRLIRIFCRTDYIDFYDKYFFKHETLRKDLENNYITLYSKKDINLQTVDSS